MGALVSALPLLLAMCNVDRIVSARRGPVSLVFTVQPSNVEAGDPITPPVEITARDPEGRVDSSFTGMITVSVGEGPNGDTLRGERVRPASAGVAAFPGLTLHQAGDGYTLVASAPGLLSAMSEPFAITERRPATLTKVSGDNQTGTVGTALGSPFRVRVTSAAGTGVAGVTVTWAVTSGGGSISPTSITTDTSGYAEATMTLGTTAGTHEATATVADVIGSPATFTAAATVGNATTLAKVSGDAQTAPVGTALGAPFRVRVTDAGGNGVAGVTVSWAVTSGGGSISPTSTPTDGSGHAQATRTLGTTAGQQQATATVAGLTGSPATFTATATVGNATTLAKVSGDNQIGTVGTALGAPFRVRVTDASGNGVAGVTVSWAVTSGGGSISPASTPTDASGFATATRTLGTTAGQQQATASATGLTGSPATFTATATPAAPATLTKVSGDNQTGTVGTALGAPFRVRVTDASGNGVAGVTVTWAVTSGGGSISPTTTPTDASGHAQATRTLGTTAGQQQATATVAGLTGSPATFTATATVGSASTLVKVSGDGQTDTVGATLRAPFRVRVTDAAGNGVAGVTVTWAVTSGGGSIDPTSSTTDPSGNASATRTLGPTAGPQQATASVTGLSPATFSATAMHGAPAQLVFTQQPRNTAANAVISPPVRVTIRDRLGNVATSFTGSVTMSIAPLTGTPGATLSGTLNRTPVAGVATFDDLRVNLVGVAYRLRAAAAGRSADSSPFNVTP